MCNVLQAVLVAAVISFGATALFAQVTRPEIQAAISSESAPALIARINSLPHDARRRSAVEMISYMNQEFASNGEFGNGKLILSILPDISDDDLLANALRRYLDDKQEGTRFVSVIALSRGRGTETGKLMAEIIRARYDKLPVLPYRPLGEDETRALNENAIAFTFCLKGLLLSSSPEAQEQGRRYLSLLRARYSSGAEGKAVLDSILGELKRGGALVDAGTSRPPDPNSTQFAPKTTLTPPSNETVVSPLRATNSDDAEPPHSRLWTYSALGFAFVVLIIISRLVVKRRRSRGSH
jgi:hypothetical protein